MNNLKKVGLSALAGSLAMVSANAVEYSVAGDAQAVWSSQQGNENATEASNGKGIGVDTDLAFSASGELDNGFTVSISSLLNTDGTVTNSSNQMAIGMGSLGTLQFNDVLGSAANGIDDVLPFAYEEPWDGSPGTNEGNIFGSATTSGSLDYRSPSFDMMGASLSATYTYDPQAGVAAPSAGDPGTDGASGEAFTVKIAHESGLTIGGGNETVGNTDATVGQTAATGYAKYSNGPLTIGYQEFYYNAATGAADTDGSGYAIAYSAGDMSFSYSVMNEQTKATSDTAALEEEEVSSVQASYTMGAMTLAAGLFERDNLEGIAGAKSEETEVSVSFAF
jgi:outer membrane protein OmpU